MNEVFGYRRLVAYQKAKEIVKIVYSVLNGFPKEERYAMCEQLRRASISITSNIAEGVSRTSVKEKIHFLEIAFCSMMEVSSQLEIACELGYITSSELDTIDTLIKEEAQVLSGLRKSFRASEL